MSQPEDWYEEFWARIDPSEDEGVSAVRLLGELFSDGLIARDGDQVYADVVSSGRLSAEDQYLIRRIEEAASAAQAAVHSRPASA